ncbi:WYL domain-containing transcriptional regulator [Candidatus Methylomirabilis sp.]|uniref:helix-turn-helix transcriptional regulator n=1 Tax=Candidatus Methylomirabilis sp. TaxID=2032687 RepID=UPI0030760E91
MPRNDQVTRQWHLLRRLEGSTGATIQELADSLPRELPKHLRTIRRDLAALEAAGFPLLTERTEGQVRWRLMDGYRRIPAIAFSPTELMALTFSRDLLKPLDGTQIKGALDSALDKAATALPPQGQGYVRQLRGFFSVGLGSHKLYRQHQETIDRITDAIAHLRTLQMRYYAASRNATTRREVDPYRLWYAGGALYLIAYCHLRRQVRLFAVDRIRSLTVTDRPYQIPLGFDVETYVQDALVVMTGRPVTVELLFGKSAAPWVRDRVWHPSQTLTPLRGGRLRMTLSVADTPELVGWILSFGGKVRVLEPAALAARVQDEARRILSGTLA